MGKQSVHLSDEQLARFQDGDSSPDDVRHLESCAQCGDRLRDVQSAIAAYKEYQQSIRGPLLPPAPRHWKSLDALISEGAADSGRRTFRWRFAAALAAAFSIGIAVMVLQRPNEKESARATELLTQSSRIALPEGRRISVQAGGRTLVRPAVLTTGANIDGEPEMARIQMAFLRADYSWQEPLSARSFLAWRNQLKEKRDTVSIVRKGDRQAYRVRTDNSSGILRSASLTLRAEDMRPTEGSFDFERDGIVELAEVVSPDVAPSTRARPLNKEAPVETPAGPEDTLRVLAALNAIGADVGSRLMSSTIGNIGMSSFGPTG